MRTKPILLPGAQVLLLSPTKEATPAKVNLSSVDPLHQVQGDPSYCAKPPVDFKTKIPLWPGLPWPGQAKAELFFRSQREILHNVMGHPVVMFKFVRNLWPRFFGKQAHQLRF